MFDEFSAWWVGVGTAAALVILVAVWLPGRIVRRANVRRDMTLAEQLTVANEYRKTILEVAVVSLLAVGAIFTYQQLQSTRITVDITRQAQVTDRLVRTIEQIASDNQAEQIGGMYGLRSLAIDAAAQGDLSFLELLNQTLTAFVRQHAPYGCAKPPCVADPEARPKDAVQVAMYLLGDRDNAIGADLVERSRQSRTLNLRKVDLRGADLANLRLNHIDFQESNLSRADITGTDLDQTDLGRTILADIVGRDKVTRQPMRWS